MDEVVERGSANLKFEWDELGPPERLVLAAMAHAMASGNGPLSTASVQELLNSFDIDIAPGDLATAHRNLINTELVSGESLNFTVDSMRLWVQEHQKVEWVKEELAGPIEELRRIAELARAEKAARRRPARIGVLAGATAVVAGGIALLVLILFTGGGAAAQEGPKIARSIPVNQCEALDIQRIYNLDWCIVSADVLKDTRQVRLNVSWTVNITDVASKGQVVRKGAIDTIGCLNNPLQCLYLEDSSGNQYRALQQGGAAEENSLMEDGSTVNGWFLFPPLPNSPSFAFVFPEDNVRIDNIVLQ